MENQQIETAARHACKLLDLVPDAPAKMDGTRLILNWELLAPKVREQWAILEGIDLVGRQTWEMPLKG